MTLLCISTSVFAQQATYLTNFPVSEFVSSDQVAVIAPDNAVEHDASRLGQPQAIPLPVFRAAVTAGFAEGRVVVLNGENPTRGPALLDPVTSEPLLHSVFQAPRSQVPSFRAPIVRANFSGDRTVDLTRGPEHRIEAGGSTANAYGPYGISEPRNQAIVIGGEYELMFDIQASGSSVASSGVRNFGSATSYDFVFDTTEQVVLFGLVYNNWTNFQSGRTSNDPRVFMRAYFASGAQQVISSNELNEQRGEHDIFFGVEAPAGDRIERIQVWTIGRNARVFAALDDLTIGLATDQPVNLTATAVGGTGTITGAGSHTAGTPVALTAAAAAGFEFVGWRFAGAPDSFFSQAAEVTVTSWFDRAYEAVFQPEGDFTLTILVEGDGQAYPTFEASTSPAILPTVLRPSYPAGTFINLAAMAANGATFTGWSGDAEGTAAATTVQLDQDRTVTATFAPATYKVALSFSGSSAAELDTAGAQVSISMGATPVDGGGTVAGLVAALAAAEPVPFGTVVTLNVTGAPAGKELLGYRGLTNGMTVPAEIPLQGPNATYALPLVFGNTRVYTPPEPTAAGSVISSRPAGTYSNSTSVLLQAVPADGHVFLGWSGISSFVGGSSASTARVEAIMNGDLAPVANFAAGYNLIVVASPAEAGLTSAPKGFAAGSPATVTEFRADANPGWFFDGWDGEGVTSLVTTDTYATANVSVSGPTTVTARFVPTRLITAEASPSGRGTITGAGEFRDAQAVSLAVTPSTGWTFIGWTGEVPTGQEMANPLEFSSTENRAVVANFEAIPYTLTVNAENGRVSRAPEQATYLYGDVVNLLANPNLGYRFTGWSGALTSTANPLDLVMLGDLEVTASFTRAVEYAQLFVKANEVDGPAEPFFWQGFYGGSGTALPAGQFSGSDLVWGVSNGPGETEVFPSKPNRIGFLFAADLNSTTPPPEAFLLFTEHLGSLPVLDDSNNNPQTEWWASVEGAKAMNTLTLGELAGLSIYSNNGTAGENSAHMRFAIRAGGTWYASATVFRHPVSGWQRQFLPHPDTELWHADIFVAGERLATDVSSLPSSTLPGTTVIDAYGWYADTDALDGSGSRVRADTFRIITKAELASLTFGAFGNGGIDGAPAGDYAQGATVTLTAVAAVGSLFTGWTGDVTLEQAGNPVLNLTLNGAVSVYANFAAETQELTLVASDPVAGAVNGAGSYPYGSVVNIEAVPSFGFAFTGWTGGEVANPAAAATTVSMTEQRALTANFTARNFADWMDLFGSAPVDLRGPQDDANANGIANLLEFVLGRSPVAEGRDGLPSVGTEEIEGVSYVVIRYRVSAAAIANGIDVTAQVAEALGDWQDVVGGSLGAVVTDEAGETVIRLPLATAQRLFRLRAAQQADQ